MPVYVTADHTTVTWTWSAATTSSATFLVDVTTFGGNGRVMLDGSGRVYRQPYVMTADAATPLRPPEPDPEQIARRRARDAAQARAEATLLSLLSPAERERYSEIGAFHVQGSAGGRYSVHRGYMQNVYDLDQDGRRRSRLCAHPAMRDEERRALPVADAMIAQLLMLRYDEPGFLSIANRDWVPVGFGS